MCLETKLWIYFTRTLRCQKCWIFCQSCSHNMLLLYMCVCVCVWVMVDLQQHAESCTVSSSAAVLPHLLSPDVGLHSAKAALSLLLSSLRRPCPLPAFQSFQISQTSDSFWLTFFLLFSICATYSLLCVCVREGKGLERKNYFKNHSNMPRNNEKELLFAVDVNESTCVIQHV